MYWGVISKSAICFLLIISFSLTRRIMPEFYSTFYFWQQRQVQ